LGEFLGIIASIVACLQSLVQCYFRELGICLHYLGLLVHLLFQFHCLPLDSRSLSFVSLPLLHHFLLPQYLLQLEQALFLLHPHVCLMEILHLQVMKLSFLRVLRVFLPTYPFVQVRQVQAIFLQQSLAMLQVRLSCLLLIELRPKERPPLESVLIGTQKQLKITKLLC
jgi:hypothetical protein